MTVDIDDLIKKQNELASSLNINTAKSSPKTARSSDTKIESQKKYNDRDDVFNVFKHPDPSKKIEFVNPTEFSWIGFFFCAFYLLWLRRWLTFAIILCIGFLIEFVALVIDLNALVHSILWLIFFFCFWHKANSEKVKSLLRESYDLVDQVKAESKQNAKAHYFTNKEKEEVPVKNVITALNTGNDQTKLDGVAKEIESFAILRSKGMITEKEFQQKKLQLLNL